MKRNYRGCYYTENLRFQVLTLKDGNDEYGTEVQLQDKKSPITSFTNYTEDQKWYRKWWNTFDSDYFVLIGGQTQRLLTAEGTEKLFIGGKLCTKYLLMFHSLHQLVIKKPNMPPNTKHQISLF